MMPRRRGLVSRISLTLSLWVGGIWLLSSGAVAWYVQDEITDAFDAALAATAHRLLDLVVHEINEIEGLSAPGTPVETTTLALRLPFFKEVAGIQHDMRGDEYVIYQVFNTAGKLILRSAGAPTEAIVSALIPGFSDSPQWRSYGIRYAAQDIFMVVADAKQYRRETQRDTLLWLILPLLGLLPLLLLIVHKVTRAELMAVQQIASEIATRGGRNLTPIAVTGLSTELNSISENTNHLLLRLEEALKTERALAANAAHELRTPLAAARLSLSTAQSYPMSESAREATVQVALSLALLGKRAEKLLQFSRAEAAATLSQEGVDLAALTSAVAQEFWQSQDACSRLKLSLPEDDADAVIALGDFDSLAIALRNLIENALKYAPHSDIDVVVSSPATITVRDTGPGVLADDLIKLQQRHVQLDANQAGYGLGLSIVRTIIEKQGGRLELRSPPAAYPHGFEAALILRK